jgi:HSP20 family protein
MDSNDVFADDFFTRDRKLPAMNVKETKDIFEIELAVPGFTKKDIEVTLEDDYLEVHAEKSKEVIEDESEGYTRREFTFTHFDRRMHLPTTINPKKEVKATYKNGILSLKLTKKVEIKEIPKKIIEIA